MKRLAIALSSLATVAMLGAFDSPVRSTNASLCESSVLCLAAGSTCDNGQQCCSQKCDCKNPFTPDCTCL